MIIRSQLLNSLREACVTMLAAGFTLISTQVIASGIGPGVLAVVLALSLSRSHLDRDRRGRIEAAIILPFISLIAVATGFLLLHKPWLGALLFIACMFISIWVCKFGAMAKRAGSLIALPFVVLLTTPYIAPERDQIIPAILLPVVVAFFALFWVSILHAAAERFHFLTVLKQVSPESMKINKKNEAVLRPIASTRMAIQMAVALGISFLLGFLLFPTRWTWIVLTTIIVLSGNRGRLDVVHKSVLRVAGAAIGTFIAITIHTQMGLNALLSHGNIALILTSVFFAIWLRSISYGWWALFITLALALLQNFSGAQSSLGLRLEEIIFGAIIGVFCAWFVLPVRSGAVLRRRLADALACLSEALDPAILERSEEEFVAALGAVEQLLPAFNTAHLLTRYLTFENPASGAIVLLTCKKIAINMIQEKQTPPTVRRAVGAARQSLREPAEIMSAMLALKETMLQHAEKNQHRLVT